MDGRLALPQMELNANWVSKDGKTKQQLTEDMQACSREAKMASAPALPGEMGGSSADMKVFDVCMRSKGWTKEK